MKVLNTLKLRLVPLLIAAVTVSAMPMPSAVAGDARALPPRPEHELAETADRVFTGRVTAVRLHKSTVSLDWKQYLIEIAVSDQERGEKLGRQAIVSVWQRVGGVPGPVGQNELPRVGDVVKVFTHGKILVNKACLCEGCWEEAFPALEPNGIIPHHELGPPSAVPPEYLGEWVVETSDVATRTTTKTTVSVYATGRVRFEERADWSSSLRSSKLVSADNEGLTLDDGTRLSLAYSDSLILSHDQGDDLILSRPLDEPDFPQEW